MEKVAKLSSSIDALTEELEARRSVRDQYIESLKKARQEMVGKDEDIGKTTEGGGSEDATLLESRLGDHAMEGDLRRRVDKVLTSIREMKARKLIASKSESSDALSSMEIRLRCASVSLEMKINKDLTFDALSGQAKTLFGIPLSEPTFITTADQMYFSGSMKVIETLRRTFLRQSWKNPPTLELVGRPNVTKANIDSFDPEHADEYTDNSHTKLETSLFRAASEKATAKLLSQFPEALLLFVLLLVLFIVRNNIEGGYRVHRAVQSKFTGPFDREHVNSPHNFRTLSQVWKYLKGPMADALFEEPTFSNTSMAINDINFLLGGIRFKQFRARNNSCGEGCYGPYQVDEALGTRSKSAPAPDWALHENCTSSSSKVRAAFQNFVSNPSSTSNLFETTDGWIYARHGHYPPGGYSMPLSKMNVLGKEGFVTILHDLEQCGWIDRGTRLAVIEFNYYNPNNGIVASGYVGFEFDTHSIAEYIFWIDAFAVPPLAIPASLIILEGCIGLILVTILGRLLLSMINHVRTAAEASHLYLCCICSQRFCGIFQAIDFFLIFLHIGVLLLRIRLRLDTPNVLPSMDVQDFVYLGGISHAHFSLDCLGIFSTILAALRLAKFLKLTLKSLILLRTIGYACRSVFVGTISLSVSLFGFAALFSTRFGASSEKFSTVGTSFFTLLSSLFGQTQIKEILRSNAQNVNSAMGNSSVIFLFVLFIFFIAANMFLGLVYNAYIKSYDMSQKEHQSGYGMQQQKCSSTYSVAGASVAQRGCEGKRRKSCGSKKSIIKLSNLHWG